MEHRGSAVKKYFPIKGKSAKEIQNDMFEVYKGSTLSLKTIYMWRGFVKAATESLKYDHCIGRPAEAVTHENKLKVNIC